MFYPNRSLICEIKITLFWLTVVMVRYVVTGSIKYPQQTKVQKIYTSVSRFLGPLSLCFYEVIPNLYQHDRTIKSQLKITGESSMAERRVWEMEVVYACKLPHS